MCFFSNNLEEVVVWRFIYILPNNMISSFLRSTLKRSSVHSGSGGGCGACRSSSDPGGGESVLRSLLEPWSDCCCCCCCKYPLRVSHWAAMALHSNVSSGHCVLNLGWAKNEGKMCFCVVDFLINAVTSTCCSSQRIESFPKTRLVYFRKSLCSVSRRITSDGSTILRLCELGASERVYQPTSPESFTCHLGGKNDGSSQK